jgi:hypothetical protein
MTLQWASALKHMTAELYFVTWFHHRLLEAQGNRKRI